MSPAQPDVSLPASKAVVAAGATGFGVMAAELTAVRLLAPHFGDSAYVWTNVIGVILAAMAIGAMFGGRLSGRAGAEQWPFRLLLIAGGLLLLAPFTTSWLGTALLPSDLQLDAAMPALIRGSLVATAVVFAPPMMLLAAVSPLLIVLLANSGKKLGRAAGDVAAAGTIGSLLGTFAATHFLIPSYGCRIAMTVSAAILLIAAIVVAPRRRRNAAGVALLIALAMTLAHDGPLRPAANDIELLAERETAYQFLQVHKSQVEGQPSRTTLVINEALDSFHSLAIEGSAFTQNAYYDWHAIAPFLAGDGGKRPKEMRALSIGDAAGTLRRVYAAVHPNVNVDAVDIDAETMALGDEFFGEDKAKGSRYAIDGRLFLSQAKQQWHVIHVDAYAHQVYIPAHLASIEFFKAAYNRLYEGGILACNVGALSTDDPVLQAVSTTVSAVFGNVRTFLIPGSRNALLVARRDRPLEPKLLAAADQTSAILNPGDRQHWSDIITACADSNSWHKLPDDGHLLVDDRPLLDELLLDSYVDNADQKAVTSCNGSRGAIEAEKTATTALQAGDWQGVLAAVKSSKEETALLRRLAGDARWYRRELHSAEIEYLAGLQLQPDPKLKRTLESRLRGASAELQPILRAEAAATRNGWLALLATIVGVALFAAMRRS